MEPIVYVLAILGCGDGSTACQEARVEPTHYQTAALCRAALPQALARNTDLAYPTIAGNCRATGERMAKADGVRPRS